jgi:hypothetical protein
MGANQSGERHDCALQGHAYHNFDGGTACNYCDKVVRSTDSISKELAELSTAVVDQGRTINKQGRTIDKLTSSRAHHGVTSCAEWVCGLRESQALDHSHSFERWLQEVQLGGWICSGKVTKEYFPDDNSLESGPGGTQEFVWKLLEPFATRNTRMVHGPRAKGGFRAPASIKWTLTCYPVADSHIKPSIGARKPDNVFRSRNDATGAHTIVVIGDNKRRAGGKFTEEEIGHILDMAKQLLVHYQKRRVYLYCFLTDGYRFQFFKVRRNATGFSFQESSVYEEVAGWQVLL